MSTLRRKGLVLLVSALCLAGCRASRAPSADYPYSGPPATNQVNRLEPPSW